MKDFIIDPSIEFNDELEELIRRFKVKVISYSDNEEILTNLYFVMKIYFNDIVIDDILKSCLEKMKYRDLMLSVLLKSGKN